MGIGGESNEVAMETLPRAVKDSQHCPPSSLGTSTTLPPFRLWVYFQKKKKKSPLFGYIYRPTERTMLLLSSKMHLTQGKGSTFRPNLPKRYRLPGGSAAATAVMSLQSCSTLCNPVDSSPPGSVVPGILQTRILKWVAIAFSPGGSVVKNLPVIAGDAGLIPGLERSLREGNGNPLQYSCLGNPIGRGA